LIIQAAMDEAVRQSQIGSRSINGVRS
jgi:hypothetical protein